MSVYSNNRLVKENVNDAWFKIFQFIQPGARILDVGCSSGNLGAALKKEKQVTVIGVDIDADDVTLAKKNLDEAHVVNVEKDSLSKFGKFDYVIMADVIEHLVDPISVLKKIKPALKSDGRFIFSIPNMANATIRIELLKGRFEYHDWGLLDRTHLHFYDHHEIDRVFSGAGFKIESMDCTVRNIPEKILKKELRSIGLSPTKEFIDFLNEPDALTYQFIGVAVPGKQTKQSVLNTTSDLDSVSREITRIQNANNKALAERDALIAKLGTDLEHYKGHSVNLENELKNIKNSRAWKLVENAAKIRNKTIRRRKS